MTTTLIKIKTRIGKNCITIGDGQKIYQSIHKSLSRNTTVKLDFSGVEVFASPFFNAAIGQLLKDIDPEILNKHLKIESISPAGKNTLQRVIENSKKYYADSDYRESIGALLREYSEAS
jgi:hypothetical protein